MISEYDHKLAVNSRVKAVKDTFIKQLRAFADFDEGDVEKFLIQHGYVSPPKFRVSFEVEASEYVSEDDVSDEIYQLVEDGGGYTIINSGVYVTETSD